MTNKYSPTIGFEVHAELATLSKMFCGCKADHFGKPPNTQTCPVCLGLPGALPTANQKAVEWTIKIGLALNCTIANESKFDRKHYFYPDLPKGYQISQYDQPLCTNGFVDTSFGRVGIERVHLEEDTGKLQHALIDGKPASLVDFNRSGVPLVEIVTRPDIHSVEQALEYAKNLRETLISLGVSDCDMEKGSMRLEANISLGLGLGYKVEVKNVNSFRFIGKAIDYELDRQKKLLDSGQTPAQETRGWHEKSQTTRAQRTKETAADYRYFPEPDIPPLIIDSSWIETIKNTINELPHQKVERWVKDLGLREDFAKTIVKSAPASRMMDEIAKIEGLEANFVNQIASKVVNKQIDENISGEEAVKKIKGLSGEKVTDEHELEEWVKLAVASLPGPASEFSSGNDKALGVIVGKVMGLSKGKADGAQVKNILEKHLRSEKK